MAGLRQQAEAGVADRNPDGLSPAEALHAIDISIREMVAEQYDCWLMQPSSALEKENVRIVRPTALEPEYAAWLTAYFDREVFPVLANCRRPRPSFPSRLEQEPVDRRASADRRFRAA